MRPKFVALLSVSALALAGCSTAAEPAPEATESAAPAARQAIDRPASAPEDEAASKKEQAEEAFLVEYKQVAGNLELYSKEELVEIGYDACDLMESGASVPHDFTGDTQGDRSVGIPAGMAAKVTLCPEVTE